MKKKRIITALAGTLLISLLTGCGDGSEPIYSANGQPIETTTEPSGWATVSAPPVYSTPEPGDASQVKLLHFAGELSKEEEAAAKDAMTTLYQNMEVAEYLGEAIHMVATEEWFEDMLPRNYVGSRSYTLQQGELALLTVQVGEDSNGVLYADVRFQDADGRFLLLKQFGAVTQLLETTMVENEMEGPFNNWILDSKTGGIVWEKGTYVKGVMTGEYSKSTRTGSAGDAFDLWTNRENFRYETVSGIYDEQGNLTITATPEPKATLAPTPGPTPVVTPKPAVTPKPTARPAVNTPRPTAVPDPEPEPDDDDDDDDNDDNNDDNNGGGEENNGGDNNGNNDTDNDPPQGGEVDSEWTPDID